MVDMKKIAIWGDSVLKGVVLEEGKDRYSLLKDSSIELIKREYNLMIKNNSTILVKLFYDKNALSGVLIFPG